ncbi:MAG: hypothetical protein ACO1RT_20760 [Planctomycetaceae bacterium]
MNSSNLCEPCQADGVCAWQAKGAKLPRLCPMPEVVAWNVTSAPFDRLDQVRLITPHFNPAGFVRTAATYDEWLPTLGELAEALRCYEMVLDDDAPAIAGSVRLPGTRELHAMFQKEALINRALQDCDGDHRLRYFGWLDHDMVFENPHWLEQAVAAIDAGAAAVQLFDGIDYLGPDHSIVRKCASRSKAWVTQDQDKPGGSPGGNPGGSWLVDIEFLRRCPGGLYPFNMMGGGDQAWFSAVVNRLVTYHTLEYSHQMAISVIRWCYEVTQLIGDRPTTYIDGKVRHLWHGDFGNRAYNSHYRPVRKYNLDPSQDLRINSDGLLEWASDKPGLHAEVLAYFASRKEDG